MLDLARSNPNEYFMVILVVIFSVCLHEYMHARVALWQGDSTAADQGHLTLNPLKQMGMFSLVLVFIIGVAFGSVPVDHSRMKHRYSPALVAFAGPFINLVLFLLFCMGIVIVTLKSNSMSQEVFNGARELFTLGAVMNVVLFCLNMLPIPILDGYEVLAYYFPGMHRVDQKIKNTVFIVMAIAILASSRFIFMAGYAITFLTVNTMVITSVYIIKNLHLERYF
ncbi:MAG: site-2 protease family protein [Victivallales bacterium]